MPLCMKMSPRMVETERVPLRRLAQITATTVCRRAHPTAGVRGEGVSGTVGYVLLSSLSQEVTLDHLHHIVAVAESVSLSMYRAKPLPACLRP